MRARLLDFTRGLLALTLLLALLLGVPFALATVVGWPLPTAIPSLARVLSALRYGQVADSTLVKILAVLVWVAWAQLSVSVAVEAVAITRGRIATRVPGAGPFQQAAARLVPAALLVFTSFSMRPASAAAHPTAAVWSPPPPAATQQQPEPPTPPTGVPPPATAAEAPDQPPPAPFYEVRRGDTLWDLAERFLADGHRWRDIRDLNVGRPQPDGSALAAGDDLIRRGWLLALPPGARPLPAPQEQVAAETTVTVAPGDSLSAIAERAYGDADRYPAIYDANRGRPQPDGQTLDDPDLIRPGWLLQLPTVEEPPVPAEPAASGVQAPPSPALPSPPPPAVPGQPVQREDASAEDAPRSRHTPAPPTPALTETEAPAADSRDTSDDLIQPATIASGALLAASLLWTLTRLRARQMRRRRPGRDVPRPSHELRAAERLLRSAAADAPLEWVDATLRLLTVRLRQRPTPGAVPPLLCIRAGSLGVETLLAYPDHDPPEGFVTRDGGYTWQLDPAVTLDELRQAAGQAPPVAPAMVTLGETPEGLLLVNLEQLPVLRVEGPDEQVTAFLAGVTVELATAPWATSVTVHPVTGSDTPLARLPGVQPVADLNELVPQLSTFAEANRAAIGTADGSLAARITPDGEDWPPVVVVVPTPQASSDPAVHNLDAVARTVGGGVALVLTGAPDNATWRLHLSDDGTATLEPLGLRVTASGLDPAAVNAAAGLLENAAAGDIARPTPLPQPRTDHPAQPAQADSAADEQLDPLPVEVAVLGPPTVTGWAVSDVRPKSAEIVAYLAVQNRPVPTDKLRTALWPDGINYNSFKTSLSRTRRALGIDASGAFHLPEAKDGRYRLGPQVGCDWTRFQTLTQTARTAPPLASWCCCATPWPSSTASPSTPPRPAATNGPSATRSSPPSKSPSSTAPAGSRNSHSTPATPI